jgi:diguanylate cyclase (GGDEF)-like protein/PAS domain S-box-containing protein
VVDGSTARGTVVPEPGASGLPSAHHLGRALLTAVQGHSFVPLNHVELQNTLVEQAAVLLGSAVADPVDRTGPRAVGAWLVAAHLTDPVSVEHTVAVLGEQLAAVGVDRLAAVQGALAAGYAQAMRERTRAEQERISTAAFAARAAAERARWSSEARFEAIFADAATGIAIVGVDGGTFIEVNRALCEMFGLASGALVGTPIARYVRSDDELAMHVHRMRIGALDHARLERSYARTDGTRIWVDLVLSLVRAPDGAARYIVGMLADVTERHRLETSLRHQAQHDPLTGLPNRTVFFERLDAALAAGPQSPHLGVCYLDVDGFKAVNDTLGHAVGDQLLQEVAGRLAAELEPAGHLVARMGGDEFVVLVQARDGEPDARDEVRRVARAALETVRRPIRLDGHRVVVSASVGVVERDDGGAGSAELMKAADTTLYWAKKDGRNRIAFFDAERHRADVGRFALSAQMPEALANGEFVVHYQPLVRLSDQHLVGVEALVRWERPSGQRLGPDRFIPVAEETGLIVPLGRWVLAEACRQAVAWRAACPRAELFVSVNLAARQVREPGIVEDVARILDETGWPAHALQLELTESDLMGTTGEPLDALHALAAMGVRIAIDDFGTGYSNLAYLRSLPVHSLKLAGPFMSGRGAVGDDHTLDADEVDHEVLALLIELAHTLGLSVTAEVVETAVQLERLRKLGCDTGQGWYFAPAVDAGAVPELLHGPVGPV